MDSSLDTTLRLVRDAQGGDERALDDLFRRYLPRTRRIVACRMGWRLRQLEEHEDIVQATLLRVFQGLDRFEARTEGSFRHWVASCVECTIRNAVRDSRRMKRGGGKVRRWSELANESVSGIMFAAGSPTASAIAQASEAEERIERALLELPDRYREVIVLRDLCGMSYAEVAEAIGAEREATVRQVHVRAVQKLKDLLGA